MTQPPIVFEFRYTLKEWICWVISVIFSILIIALQFVQPIPHPTDDPRLFLGAMLVFFLALHFPFYRTHRIRFEAKITREFGFGRTQIYEYQNLKGFESSALRFSTGRISLIEVSHRFDLLACLQELIDRGVLRRDQVYPGD